MNLRNRPPAPSALVVAAVLATTLFSSIAPSASSATTSSKVIIDPSQQMPSNERQSQQNPFSLSGINIPIYSEQRNGNIFTDREDDLPDPPRSSSRLRIFLCIWTDTRAFEPDPVHKPPWNSLIVV